VPEPPALFFLSRVEALLEAIAEGGFRRLFSPRLQPAEVARVLASAMVSQKVVGTSSLDVPTHYVAHLNPADFERFASFQGKVERDLAAHLDRRADEEGYRPLGRIRVEIVPDPAVRKSFVRAEGLFEDVDPLAVAGAIELTRKLDPLPAEEPKRTFVLEAEDGQRVHIAVRTFMIGRAPENDLVVRDLRVSRQHAAIELRNDGCTVRDLQSSNGTFVDGQRIDEAHVGTGAELSLGGYRVRLRPD
jgi:hypothetical protein